MIDLRCQDVTALLAGLPDGSAALIHADPPWDFENGGNGKAKAHYACLPDSVIAEHIASTHRIAADDCYLTLWCTFPKLAEWLRHDSVIQAAGWNYLGGGAWGKPNGIGIGFHMRGDAELLLLYRRGKPHPLAVTSNLWLSPRTETHSEKPQNALRALVRMATPRGGLVVDCYAGESASMAMACRALGRRYVGAELDPARHARALIRLSQQEMAWEGVA